MAENARVERIAQFGGADLRAIKTGLGRCHHDRPKSEGVGTRVGVASLLTAFNNIIADNVGSVSCDCPLPRLHCFR